MARVWITSGHTGTKCDSVAMDAPTVADRMLNPAARLLWRSATTLQIELGDRAVVVDGPAARAVRRLAGRRKSEAPARSGRADPVLRTLSEAGFLWSRPLEEDDDRLAPPAPRLAPELTALAARHGERAAELLNARRHVTVVVHGSGRTGPHIAAVLAAAGVGRINVLDLSAAHLNQSAPGGLSPADEGRNVSSASAEAIRRAAPEADVRPLAPADRPDLVVLACDEPVDPDRRAALHARGTAHLLVRLGPEHGVVGPLVIPGLTSCLHCADLHRLDRDPAWTALAVQLAAPHRGGGSDITVATLIAGLAAQQALAYLDGEQPATIDGTLEQHLPDWRIRRRSWPAHPDCDCSGIR
jgi:bacteriocin biosynthesis cyclodehydratase domain-containing protein